MIMLRFRNFKKAYFNKLIIEIENVDLEKGVYWIRGSNGSGKSTLLKSVAGMIPFEGEISLFGLPNTTKNAMAYRKMVNYSDAEPLYPEYLKGIDLISFYRSINKTPSRKSIDELLERFKMKDAYLDPIGSYSSGMKKKLALILAFIGSPKLILLDEPLVALDYDAVKVVKELIVEFTSIGSSVLFTSHQEFENEVLFELQVLVIENNKLISTK